MTEEQELTKKELRAKKRAEKLEKKIEEESRVKRESFAQNIFTWSFVALLGGGLIFFVIQLMSNETPGLGGSQEIVITNDDYSKGNPDSGVVLVEYGDFQCPACGTAFDVVESILDRKGDDMLFVFRDYPVLGPRSYQAARVAKAAGEQGKYFEMYELLFANQSDWTNSTNAESIFEDYAEQIGLDMDLFNADISSDDIQDRVSSDLSGGRSLGVTATPTFFLNGEMLSFRNYNQFEDLIDAAILEAQENATPEASDEEEALGEE